MAIQKYIFHWYECKIMCFLFNSTVQYNKYNTCNCKFYDSLSYFCIVPTFHEYKEQDLIIAIHDMTVLNYGIVSFLLCHIKHVTHLSITNNNCTERLGLHYCTRHQTTCHVNGFNNFLLVTNLQSLRQSYEATTCSSMVRTEL